MDGIYMGEHVVQFKDERMTIVPFLIPIEDEGMGLRPIQYLAGTWKNHIPVLIPPHMQ